MLDTNKGLQTASLNELLPVEGRQGVRVLVATRLTAVQRVHVRLQTHGLVVVVGPVVRVRRQGRYETERAWHSR